MTKRSSGIARSATFGLLALILLLAVAPAGPVIGDAGLGHGFYGTVKLDGQDAAVGTVVSARVGGTVYGSWEVQIPGQYALVVQGDIVEGATVDFYVSDRKADQTHPFYSGWTTPLDLTATTPTYTLVMAADPEAGGNATDLTNQPLYPADSEVSIEASANQGYRFTEWTSPAGEFVDATLRTATFIMPDQNVTVTANFVEAYALNMTSNPEAGGTAIDVTGDPPYTAGAEVEIRAEPEQGYRFVNWSSEPEDLIDDEEAEETFLTMPAKDVTVTANFQSQPEVPTVTTGPATDITTRSAVISMTYTTGNYSAVDVRFSVKRATDVTWFHDTWVSRTEDGTYAYGLTELSANTEYEFKAQLKYDDTVIEGEVRRFITASESTIFFPPFCFIATAAYGTPSAEQIDVLREFRDVVLAENRLGSRFVTLYYQLSPPVAEVISESSVLRTLTREFLVDPVVWIVEATGHLWRR
ncbi:MAG: InlB B-repeat-containing protein [Dehalococcoidia bacterium]